MPTFAQHHEEAIAAIDGLIDRIHDRDHTVWQDDPTEVANRLGWLDAPATFLARAEELEALASEVRADGIDRVLLVGMGGSSLYPDVLTRAFGPTDRGCAMTVLDTTNPTAVRRTLLELEPHRTLVVPASKSGTTIETRTLFDTLWEPLVEELGEDAGDHVVAITDPGSTLVSAGEEHGFRRVVENPADIGGRFAALSAFGLVPAALLGLDVAAHVRPGVAMVEESRQPFEQNGPAQLGAFLAAAMAADRHALTIHLPSELAPFGDWIEQLVAESTGKHGTGLLPVLAEPVLEADAYGPRRALVVHDTPDDGGRDWSRLGAPVHHLPAVTTEDVAAEVVRWEFATALAGALASINPFDQPNVQAAKSAAAAVLEQEGEVSLPLGDAQQLLDSVSDDDVLAVLAWLDPAGDGAAALPTVAEGLRARLGVPVTVGIGPRYLHSTGQLHKGGPDEVVLALVVDPEEDLDVAIPGRDLGFRRLFRGQAAGDLAALRDAGRRVAVVTLDDLRDAAIA